MIGTLAAILGFAMLFALFAALRPPDASSSGCHACTAGEGSGECGAKCPLLQDHFPDATRSGITTAREKT